MFPDARRQRCWVHETANVLNASRRRPSPSPQGIAGHPQRQGQRRAVKAVAAFEKTYAPKWPKAVKKITHDIDEVLAFYDVPAEHCVHLRTTNPIASPFATVLLNTEVTHFRTP